MVDAGDAHEGPCAHSGVVQPTWLQLHGVSGKVVASARRGQATLLLALLYGGPLAGRGHDGPPEYSGVRVLEGWNG